MHPCDKAEKGGCEQICNKKGEKALCGCNDGFKVSTEDSTQCVPSKCPSSIHLSLDDKKLFPFPFSRILIIEQKKKIMSI